MMQRITFILSSFFLYFSLTAQSTDYLEKYKLPQSYADKLFVSAGLQSPSLLSHIAYDVYMHAEDYYRAGKYQKSKELLDLLWQDYPPGTEVWHDAHIDEGILNIGTPNCYYALRMLTEVVDWKLRHQKNPVKIPRIIQFTVVIPGKSQGIQPRNKSELKSKKGVMKTNIIHPNILKSDFKVVHQMMWLFNEYVSAISDGKLKVVTKILYLPQLTLPASCEGNYCGPSGSYHDLMLKTIPEETKDETDFWWLICPSHVPESREFDSDYVTGGMGEFNNGPFWISDDLSHVRKRKDSKSIPYREEEHRTYFSQWFMHEFYHFVFDQYPEFQLEAESHQWFYKENWPSDFVGIFEPDYYTEALHKRILTAKPSFINKLTIANRSEKYFTYIDMEFVKGIYRRNPFENKWHTGNIQPGDEPNSFVWLNSAGVKWSLTPELTKGVLRTGTENPYYKNGSIEFKLILRKDDDGNPILKNYKGKQIVEIEGFKFNGEIFYKK